MDFLDLASATGEAVKYGSRFLLGNNEEIDPAESSTQQRPFLSAAAEAELFMLATNFLLYVAMVIITTIVAKIYFPESLTRGGSAPPFSHTRRVDVVHDDYEVAQEDDNSDKDSLLADLEYEADGGEGTGGGGQSSHKKKDDDSTRIVRGRSFPMALDFDQLQASKAAVLKRLVFCAVVLNVTFITWGVLQERMLTRRYPRLTGEYFVYSYALVFSNRFWTSIMSGLLMWYLRPIQSKTTVIYEYSFSAISNMLSSWCQYEALRYVSFPAVTLFKSFKMAPVMAMGKFLGNKNYPQYDYVVALVIGAGIAVFMTSTDNLALGYDIYGSQTSQAWTGIMMLCLFLFFDSFTGQWQSRMFQRHRDLSMIELLFATSTFSTVLSFITLVHTRELGPAMEFVYRHSEIQVHFFVFSICSTIGQLAIFYTIKNFGAVVFSIIMTLRVLLSIALSCILYGHKVSAVGFFGLTLVLGAILYRVKRKAEGTQLIKWQGVANEEALELVHQWHEQMDM